MSVSFNKEKLIGRWVHSHEEDTAAEMVFRPATFNFPPSHGRESFELKPDGGLIEYGIGPTDRRQATQGTWELEKGEKLIFHPASHSAPHRVMPLAFADKDRLVIKK